MSENDLMTIEEQPTHSSIAPYQNQDLQNDPRQLVPVMTAQAMANRLQDVLVLKDTAMKSGYHYGPPFPGSDKNVLLKPGMEMILGFFGLYTLHAIESRVLDPNQNPPFLMYEIRSRIVINGTNIVIAEGFGSANSYEIKYRYRNVPREMIPANLDADKLQTTGGIVSEPAFVIDDRLIPNGITKQLTDGKYGKPEAYWQAWLDAIQAGKISYREGQTRDGKPMKWCDRDETLYRVPNDAIYDVFNTILKIAEKRADMDATLKTGVSALFAQDEEMRDLLANAPMVIEYDEEIEPEPLPQRRDLSDRRPAESRPKRDSKPAPQPSTEPPATERGSQLWADYIKGWTQKEWFKFHKAYEAPTLDPGLTEEEAKIVLGEPGQPLKSFKDFKGTRDEVSKRLIEGNTAKREGKPPFDKPAEPTTEPGQPFDAPEDDDEPADSFFVGDEGYIACARVMLTAQDKDERPLITIYALDDVTGEDIQEAVIDRELTASEADELKEIIPAKISKRGTVIYDKTETPEDLWAFEWTRVPGKPEITITDFSQA